ncbi:MAG: outer membrane protein Omp31 precursor [Rhizobium sp.]|nr:outer membrane protein Omp31 precursor [Rhizobium sp.]
MRKVTLALAALLGTTALAAAADLPSRGYAPAPVYAAPIFTWTGFYIGVNAGYGGDKNSYSINGLGNIASITSGGFIGGGQIGYNYQFLGTAFVLGLEADLQATNIEGKVTILGLGIGSKLDYLGTVRARLGYAFTDRALIYATGGLAYGRVKTNIANIISFGGTNTGWTAGAGIEYALTQNWSLKTEYLYVDLGSKSSFLGLGNLSVGVKNHEHIVRAGLNYRFNWGAPSAVVAKY